VASAYIGELDKVNGRLQIVSKINELPLYPLPGIFLLFQHEHMVIEELLQLLICIVDAKLLKAVGLLGVNGVSIAESSIPETKLPRISQTLLYRARQ
jgi:hypothetical protein